MGYIAHGKMLSYLAMRISLTRSLIAVSLLATSCVAVRWCLPAHSLMLQAQVEHSERLAPVGDALAPGQPFDLNKLTPLQDSTKANRWYRVPQWLVGRWHKDSQTDYYRYDFATQKTDTTTSVQPARSDGVWGTQVDDSGQVWQFDVAPFVTRVDAGEEVVVQVVRSSEPVEDTPTHFVRRSIDTQFRVDKASNVIKSVESGEQLTAYIPESDGLLKRESSSKVFDRYGAPLVLGKSFSYETRIGPFVPQDTYEGKDLRALFKQFIDDKIKSIQN